MKKFSQLSLEQRYQIEILIEAGHTKAEIARMVDVHRSTICREIKRNTPLRGIGAKQYIASKAQVKTDVRHETKPKRILFDDRMKLTIIGWMDRDRLSPELICARARSKNVPMVSHETIYEWIWEMKKSNKKANASFKDVYKYLKHGRRHRKRGNRHDSRGIIPNRTPIEQRPAIVEQRKRVGDVEADLMMGSNHQSALLVITDRATIRTYLRKLDGKDSADIKQKMIAALKQEKHDIKTITFDNDMAFAEHHKIAQSLNASAYFTRPYCSQDKGTVENRIGVIRMFLPKKSDLSVISTKRIREIQNSINNRPVRKFNYLTPNQLYAQKLMLH